MKQTRISTLRQQKLVFLKEAIPTAIQTRSQSFKQSVSHISPEKKSQSPVKQAIFLNGMGPVSLLKQIEKMRPKSKYQGSQSTTKIMDNLTFIQKQSPVIHRKNVSDSTLPKISPIKGRYIVHQQSRHDLNQIDLFKREPIKQPLIMSISQRTQAGKTEDRMSKTNQDSLIAINQFGDSMSLFGVCDGHGQEGHKCSQYVRDHLPKNIRQCLATGNINEALTKAFLKTNTLLCNSSDIVSTFSGSTTVITLIVDRMIYCANIGDSRAIICRQLNNGQISSIALSIDHKPDLPIERKRIEANGGRIEAYTDYDGSLVGPARVWLKEADVPGLAMSRSFGDKVAASVGVSSEPEILTHQIQDNDLFLVLASDGVWEFLDNDQVIDLVYPYYSRDEGDNACLRVIKESTKHWKQNDTVIDDITCVVVFFNKQN